MPSPESVEARLTEAESAAKRARAEEGKESKNRLDALLAKPRDERFKALEDPKLQLLPKHRLELLRSLQETEEASPKIIATTASWWAIFRSRLPYRWWRYGFRGALAIAALLAIVAGYRHTPIQWVTLNQDTRVYAVMPDGRQTAVILPAATPFTLIRRTEAEYTVRWWVAGQGYAEATFPVSPERSSS